MIFALFAPGGSLVISLGWLTLWPSVDGRFEGVAFVDAGPGWLGAVAVIVGIHYAWCP